jgi:LmbE family N-acetylglucosaminyl deacetylase
VPTALLVSPHPDDEILGAGAAALALKGRGWRVINLALGLGRPGDRERRLRELLGAAEVMDIATLVCRPPIAMSAADDLPAAERRVVAELEARFRELAPDLLLAPSVHDAHPAHELVGRAVRDSLGPGRADCTVWWWRLWGQGGPPTLVVDCAESMPTLRRALQAHRGELERNRYAELLEAEAVADAVRGAEQVLGFGAPALATRHARVYCETVLRGGRWWFGAARLLDEPVLPEPTADAAERWLFAESPTAYRRRSAKVAWRN